MAELPHLVEVHEELSEAGLRIVAISNEDRADLERFLARTALPFAVAAESLSLEDYGVEALPTGFLIDQEGTVVWGGNPLGDDTWVEMARELLE